MSFVQQEVSICMSEIINYGTTALSITIKEMNGKYVSRSYAPTMSSFPFQSSEEIVQDRLCAWNNRSPDFHVFRRNSPEKK